MIQGAQDCVNYAFHTNPVGSMVWPPLFRFAAAKAAATSKKTAKLRIYNRAHPKIQSPKRPPAPSS